MVEALVSETGGVVVQSLESVSVFMQQACSHHCAFGPAQPASNNGDPSDAVSSTLSLCARTTLTTKRGLLWSVHQPQSNFRRIRRWRLETDTFFLLRKPNVKCLKQRYHAIASR